jgi:hypothetical protein
VERPDSDGWCVAVERVVVEALDVVEFCLALLEKLDDRVL